jgi:hypothetical protein
MPQLKQMPASYILVNVNKIVVECAGGHYNPCLFKGESTLKVLFGDCIKSYVIQTN